MNDKELADKIVALGVGNSIGGKHEQTKRYHIANAIPLEAIAFVRDWRVAGALMEKVDSCYPEKLMDGCWQAQASMDAMPTGWIINESLPRAITEACVEALSDPAGRV